MLEVAIVILLGLLGGVAVGLQSPIAGAMSQRIGGVASSFIIHVSGTVIAGVLLLIRGGEQIQDWQRLPWYMIGAGSFGVVLYLTLSYTLPRVGATAAIICIILGQLITGVVIDHFGLLGVMPRAINGVRVIALLLVLAGAYLLVRS